MPGNAGDTVAKPGIARGTVAAFREAIAATRTALGDPVADPVADPEGRLTTKPQAAALGLRLVDPSFETVPIDLDTDERRVLWSTVRYLWPGFSGAQLITVDRERVAIPEFFLSAKGCATFRVHYVTPNRWVVPRKVLAAYLPSPKFLVFRLVT
jgi:hypothetical protein